MNDAKRPKWVNLESVTGNNNSPAAHPVQIPRQSGESQGSYAKSAPTVNSRGNRETSPFLTSSSNSLVDPVLEEQDIMLSSSLDSKSSTVQRRKEAAQGPFHQTYPSYGAAERGYYDEDHYFDESEYDFIQKRNEGKREDHSTS